MITVYRWDVFTTAGKLHCCGVTIGSEQDARKAAEKNIREDKDSGQNDPENFRITIKLLRQLPKIRRHERTESTQRKKGRLS